MTLIYQRGSFMYLLGSFNVASQLNGRTHALILFLNLFLLIRNRDFPPQPRSVEASPSSRSMEHLDRTSSSNHVLEPQQSSPSHQGTKDKKQHTRSNQQQSSSRSSNSSSGNPQNRATHRTENNNHGESSQQAALKEQRRRSSAEPGRPHPEDSSSSRKKEHRRSLQGTSSSSASHESPSRSSRYLQS